MAYKLTTLVAAAGRIRQRCAAPARARARRTAEILPGPARCECRRELCDDRRMVAEERAGDGSHEPDARGPSGDRAEHGSRVGRVSLAREPRVVVIGDRDEVEP